MLWQLNKKGGRMKVNILFHFISYCSRIYKNIYSLISLFLSSVILSEKRETRFFYTLTFPSFITKRIDELFIMFNIYFFFSQAFEKDFHYINHHKIIALNY